MNLEFIAMHWLKWEKKCLFVAERTPRYNCGSRPDVLGVTCARRLIEVEVKRTFGDFKANSNKRHVLYRGDYITKWPHYFYFMVPRELVLRVSPELPEYAGLLAPSQTYWLDVIKPAPVNKEAQKMTIKECVHFARLQGNQLYNLERDIQAFRYPCEFPELDYHI